MKNALIDPNSQIEYVSGWLGPGKPIFSILPDSARVAEVANAEFPVGLPLFWTPCADDVVADQWYYDTSNQQILTIPTPPPPPKTTGVASV